MIRVETKDVLEVFRVNGMTEFAEHVATLERECDEARAAFCELYDVFTGFNRTAVDALEINPHDDWRKGGA